MFIKYLVHTYTYLLLMVHAYIMTIKQENCEKNKCFKHIGTNNKYSFTDKKVVVN